ncbi:MAG: FAD-dependent oxidoreductase [Myxococcota bacterium]
MGSTGRGVLTNFVGGARGRTLGEGTPADQARRLAADLERIRPGAAAAAAVDEARRVYWPTDPGVMGSYAGYLVGQWTSIAGSEAEAVGTLIFAGEHTATDFQGFMGGAVESGERAAAEVFGLAEGIRPTARRVAARRGGRVGMG